MSKLPDMIQPKSVTTKNREVNENVTSKEKVGSNDAFQNEVSDASSSHVERVNVRDPANFFIDLTMFENDRSMAYHEEERNESDNENQNEAIDIDEQSLFSLALLLTSMFSFADAQYENARKVSSSGIWFISFLVLMEIETGTSGERGESSRASRENGKGAGEEAEAEGEMVVEEGARVMEGEVVVEEGQG
ncbi:hypothetical protein POM88_048556 [Heracleum sosnowskyi]|uniref:Uncharacterized protein n=1 Tax=Heracleum sosnowskyi TaxID=360622 RepID=A0AAD8GWH0_9APIA|nr:hypothetical protein POM88_048556 [Heracleum sosnowskyi]